MNFNGAFWDLLDLSVNVERALAAVRGLKRSQSIVMLAVLTVIEYGLFWLVYYFDYLPTYVWSTQWSERIMEVLALSGAATLMAYAGYMVIALTVMPTLIELIGIRFAIKGMRIMGALVWLFLIFDFVTDWPYVNQFLSIYTPNLDQMGFWAIPAEWAMSILFTLMASIGFEVIFVSLAVAWLYLAVAVLFGVGGRRRQAAAA